MTLDHSGTSVTHVASPPSREDLENALTEAKRVDADLRRIIDTIPVLLVLQHRPAFDEDGGPGLWIL